MNTFSKTIFMIFWNLAWGIILLTIMDPKFETIVFNTLTRKKMSNEKLKKSCKVLGIKTKKVKKLTKAELKSIFRKLANKRHPDHGGTNKDFQDLKDAYDFVYSHVA